MMNLVSVACGEDRIENIKQAVEPFRGELSKRKINTVLLKPNLVSVDRQVANTQIGVVRCLIEFFQSLGVKRLLVGDGSGSAYYKGYSTDYVLSRFAYTALTEEYEDVEVLNLDKLPERTTVSIETIHGADTIRVLRPPADFIVSIAIPKTHDYALATLSLKNMMGLIAPEDRIKIHGISCGADLGGGFLARRLPQRVQMFFYEHTPAVLLSFFKNKKVYRQSVQLIHRNLIELFKTVMPDFSVIDGFVGMEGDGPTAGKPVPHRFALASLNPVSADALGVYLMGLDPREVGYLYYCEKEGLGSLNWSTIGDCDVETLRRKYRLHRDAGYQKKWKRSLPLQT
jgi:uncharacterized protein (DUF362 family)